MTEATKNTQQSERFRGLVDMFADDPQTCAMLTAVLEAKAAPENQQAQALAISVCLAEVMDNPLTPINLYNVIGDALTEIQTSVGADVILRTTGLVPALIANAPLKTNEAG